jgi:hypothetical protein
LAEDTRSDSIQDLHFGAVGEVDIASPLHTEVPWLAHTQVSLEEEVASARETVAVGGAVALEGLAVGVAGVGSEDGRSGLGSRRRWRATVGSDEG